MALEFGGFEPVRKIPVFSVSQLNRLVADLLETGCPPLWVSGEISNFTRAASGHWYFTLKDASAQVRCVMFRSRAQSVGFVPREGDKVEARGLPGLYQARGDFQLGVEQMRRAGDGDLYQQFLRIKERLLAEGLLESERKRVPPALPRRVGVVTSLQAAALRDVLATLRARAPQIPVVLYPTPVQGADAPASLVAALQTASRRAECDVLLLVRGGGSIEDLWAFNDERVARAVAACSMPVICGVGHETDFTIADFAADLRAATPTAAAELLSPDREALLATLQQFQRRIGRQLERELAERNQRLDWLAARLTHPAERIRQRWEAIARIGERLALAQTHQVARQQQRLITLDHRLRGHRPRLEGRLDHLSHLRYRLNNAARQQLSSAEAKLNQLGASLIQLDPQTVLNRGYALAFDENGRAVRDAGTLHPGSVLNLNFAKGTALATVNQVVAQPKAK